MAGMDTNACDYTSCPIQTSNRQTYIYTLLLAKKFPVVSDVHRNCERISCLQFLVYSIFYVIHTHIHTNIHKKKKRKKIKCSIDVIAMSLECFLSVLFVQLIFMYCFYTGYVHSQMGLT